MKKIEKTEVLIVGAGPTGLAVANDLVRFGVDTKIIEKNSNRSIHSKALGVQAGTLEALEQSWGPEFCKAMVSSGQKVQRAIVQLYNNDPVELHFDRIPSRHNYILILPQSTTEKLFEEDLQRHCCTVERETELLSLKEENDIVVSRLRHKNGEEFEVHAKFVIGADGAHSTVRNALGFTFKGGLYENEFMLADVTLDWSWPFGDVRAFITRRGALAFFPFNKLGDYRVIVANSPGTWPKDTRLNISDLKSEIEKMCSQKIEIKEHQWFSQFNVHHRMTEAFQKGRVFLAGDSAHIHSPVGGQGMNTGIQDALNLSSKLALVLKKKAPIELLENYEKQRIPVAKQVLRSTDLATRIGFANNKIFTTLGSKLAIMLIKSKFVQKSILKGISEVSVARREIERNKKVRTHF